MGKLAGKIALVTGSSSGIGLAIARGLVAEGAGVVLAVGYCRRFHPSVAEMRRRLADGRLGTVLSMVAQHTTSTGQFVAPDNWRAAPEEAPGGALTAVGVHSLDHMIELAGPVRDVRDGHFNMTHPASLVYPEANGLRVFERIPTAQAGALEDFVARRQPRWIVPSRQGWLNVLALATLAACLIAAARGWRPPAPVVAEERARA